ncbi:hypothetical protein [Actinobaculum sp. 352]|uniref:hypothetical protein n=1 Tax=Actinobaculum sp. 352 TaxID=2490946 RepID=UPI000F7EB83A|nr:hypothetical protein [Actinobaculum sp. 352]RTE48748.1 hypothetical protein EKN07_08525 [Actinobaculum sp. 352]
MRGRRRRRLTLVAACVFFVGACGTEATEHSDDAGQFSGPWAEKFESAYNSTDSEFAKTILSDGEITEAEIKETEQGMISCVEDNGYTGVGFHADGGSTSTLPPERLDQLIKNQGLTSPICAKARRAPLRRSFTLVHGQLQIDHVQGADPYVTQRHRRH